MTAFATSLSKKDMARFHRSPRSEEQYQRIDRILAHTFVRELLRRRAVGSSQPSRSSTEHVYKPRMDLFDDPDNPVVSAILELPGLKQEDISVRIESDCLVVQGERRFPSMLQGHSTISNPNTNESHAALARTSTDVTVPAQYRVQELRYGRFRRDIPLPSGLQAGDVQASLSDGMLLLAWPRCLTLEYPASEGPEAMASEPEPVASTAALD